VLPLKKILQEPYMVDEVVSGTPPPPPRGRFEPGQIGPGGSTAAGGVVDYRLDKVASLVRIEGHWLDCGSCDGEYTVALRERGAEFATGSDIDADRVSAAQERWKGRDGVRFVVATAESLPFPDHHFDGLLLNEVLEHVVDQGQALSELRRVLAPGGVLALFSPNRWFPFEGHGMIAGSMKFGRPVPILPWLPRRLSLPLMRARNYWPHELRGLVEAANFEIIHVGFAFPLFGHYPWLPRGMIERYLSSLSRIEQLPVVRRFGVSTFVLAHRSASGP
jgi:SAM-dependent methyltransferase